MKLNIYFLYLVQFFLELKMFNKKVEKIKTHILISKIFFPKIVPFMQWCEKKYCIAGQTTNDNMAHAHCMLGTYDYEHSHNIWNLLLLH